MKTNDVLIIGLVLVLSLFLLPLNSAATTILDNDITTDGNITIGDKITFRLGEIIDNLVNGFIRLQGSVNITKNLTIRDNLTITNLVSCDTIDTDADGLFKCGTDEGGATNPFDQVLNTTSNVIFANLSSTGNLTILGNATFLDRVGIGTSDFAHNLDVHGHVEFEHTADEDGDHAFEIILDAAGFGDIKGINTVYTTGAISALEDAAVILINIDQALALGGAVGGLKVLTTNGSANIIGMEVGIQVDPIQQLSGIFGNMDSATTNDLNTRTAFITAGNDTSMFVNNNENITIGNSVKFSQIEFILNTTSSGAGISPVFYFSTGVGTWTSFNPIDGTGAMKNNGAIFFLESDIPAWVVGEGSEFLIRIQRTRNSLTTVPIESRVQISSGTEFFWDMDGNAFLNSINLTDWTNVTITESQISDLNHTGASNPFDQVLNLTSNVTFDFITATGNVTSDGGWFRGLFNWTILTGISKQYLTFDGATLNFSEIKLNATILDQIQQSNDTRNPFDQALNTTSFPLFNTLNITSNFTVNTNTFFVEDTNSRVGIGTITPQQTFNVVGNFNMTNSSNDGIYQNSSCGFIAQMGSSIFAVCT